MVSCNDNHIEGLVEKTFYVRKNANSDSMVVQATIEFDCELSDVIEKAVTSIVIDLQSRLRKQDTIPASVNYRFTGVRVRTPRAKVTVDDIRNMIPETRNLDATTLKALCAMLAHKSLVS